MRDGNLPYQHVSHLLAQRPGRGDGPRAPLVAFSVLGTRWAFMAMGETRLQVDLQHADGTPVPDGATLHVIRLDGEGRPVCDRTLGDQAPSRADLSRHGLLIVEAMAAP